MIRRKQTLVISGLVVVLIIIGFFIFTLIKNNKIKSASISVDEAINLMPPPEFMNEAEKSKFDLSADSKVQILKKDESGEVEVYRVIRREADIILDVDRVGEPEMMQEASVQKP